MMASFRLLDFSLITLSFFLVSVIDTRGAEGCKGCVSLDSYNFEKIISRFEVALVKFDVAYPYGEKHDVFTKLAAEVAANKDLIIGEVGVKDYGEKENQALAEKFNLSKDDFPAIRLFVKGKRDEPIVFSKDAEWTLDKLRDLIKDNSDIYVGLPGCLEKFDKLAMKFMQSSDKREKILKEAETLKEKMGKRDEQDEEAIAASSYIKYMKKVLEVGTKFVSSETARLNKILKDGKVNDKKKADLGHRLNILRAFSLPKDEL